MAGAEPGAGDIEIELDGKTVVLSPSLGACIAINRIAGGLNGAVQRCNAMDMDTICQIVAAGLALNPTQAKQVPELVYNTGLFNLAGPCIDFINVVGNGGRPLVLDSEDDEAADPRKPA